MATTKIVKHTVEAAEPKASRYVVFDSAVPGFGLRVYPTGRKVWVFVYRPWPGGAGTPKKTALIGTTDDFTPDQARKLADKMRALVKTGKDPQAEKAAQRKAPTVEEVGSAFLADHVKLKRGSSTHAMYADLLERIVYPKFGKRKAAALSGRDLSGLHQELADRPYLANRMLAVVSAMYGWAAGPVALVPENTNPARGIERFSEERRGRVLSADELDRLGAAIRLAETDGLPWKLDPEAKAKHRTKNAETALTKIGPHAAAALRLLIFTGMRLREVLGLKWTDIDPEQGLIVLKQHKTARRTGAKTIILNAPALAVLNGLVRVGRYVIAGDSAGTDDEKPRTDLKRPWAMVREAAGLSDLRIHDLRHNFGGFGAGGGLGLPIIGKLLGHSQPATTARYSHLDNDPVRRASDAIGKRLAEAMGEAPADKNNVVPIKRGA